MTEAVTIQDDTYRTNRVRMVTPQMVLANPQLARTKYVRVLDGHRRQIQDVGTVDHIFEDRRLWDACVRARRFIRRKQEGHVGGAPKHIALQLAAFAKADPDGFREAMGHTT